MEMKVHMCVAERDRGGKDNLTLTHHVFITLSYHLSS